MPVTTAAFEQLLQYLYQSHGFDFTGYKRTTLMRRVTKRVEELRLDGFERYLDYLQVHPEEFEVLFNTILINVTAFFRDAQAWEFLREQIVPRILDAHPGDETIRVWSAGCASGEEAYSLAIVFAEAMGLDEFRRRVKIYATDVDEDALQRARQGAYTLKEIADVPAELHDKYFEIQGQRAVFRAELRRTVIFGRHDLVQDAPISRLDLLLSRNTLMYFTAEAQKRILARLHYALNEAGYLFLGRAEMLLTHAELFAPVDLRFRIFSKVSRATLRDRLLIMAPDRRLDTVDGFDREQRVRDVALDAGPAAQVVVDSSGMVTQVNQAARLAFHLGAKDVGRRLQDLELSYRPVELRSRIEQAQKERRVATVSGVERHFEDGRVQNMEVQVTPLFDEDGSHLGSLVAFHDVTAHETMRVDLERTKQERETAYEELQSTNEELQSTVEELETTNEELQSANEELETMNEELQSTNGELQTINVEMRERSIELDHLNSFMESVLTSLRLGVAVVDHDGRVQIWNRRAEDLWGLRADEVVGQVLLGLDIGLPVGDLAIALRRCLNREGEGEGEEIILPALNRRGRTVSCRVSLAPVLEAGARVGAVLLMEETTAAASAAS